MQFFARHNPIARRPGIPCLTGDALAQNKEGDRGSGIGDRERIRKNPPAEPRAERPCAIPACVSSSSLSPIPDPPAPLRSLRSRSGVTILELLIVLLILLMVTAAAIPIMAPALENRRMREAARLASSFISGARSKAIQSGREVGVVLQRFEGKPYAMTMSYVEVPPPYGGDTIGAPARVQFSWRHPIRLGQHATILSD